MKWKLQKTKAYLCKCKLVFKNRKDMIEHMKDTKRWRQYHEFMGRCYIVKGK